MKWVRMSMVAMLLGLTVAVLTSAQAQDEKKGKGGGGRGGMAGYKAPLVSSELSDKLSLTAEQKTAIEKLQKEFEEKTKDSVEKVAAAMKEMNRESMKEMREVMQTISKTRVEYHDKVKGLLKDDQKKTFEANQQQRQGGGAGGPGGGGGFGARPGANIFSAATQEKLELTSEQKEKLDKLKKEIDTRSLEILTADQKKKFEELKAAAPTRPGGGGAGGNRPPRTKE